MRPPVRRRCAQRKVGVAGAPDRAILAVRPPRRPTRQTGTTEDRRPPRQDPCHLVGSSHSTAPGPAHPVPRPARSLTDPRRATRHARPRPRSAAGGTTDRHRAPPRDVPAERRQESCRSRQAAPSGRPPLAGSACSSFRSWPWSWPSAPPPRPARIGRGGRRGVKVVIVVGPVEGQTAKYISNARSYAAVARSLGARSSRSTAPTPPGRRSSPPPRAPTSSSTSATATAIPARTARSARTTKDGLGPQRAAGHGNYNIQVLRRELSSSRACSSRRNAVVILNHLCYAAGNSEPGRANPTKSVRRSTRVDYFGAGFLRAGAHGVFASGKDSVRLDHPRAADDEPHDVRRSSSPDPAFSGRADFQFASKRTTGYHGLAGSVRDRPVLPLARRQPRAARIDGLGRPAPGADRPTHGGPGPDRRPAGAEDS